MKRDLICGIKTQRASLVALSAAGDLNACRWTLTFRTFALSLSLWVYVKVYRETESRQQFDISRSGSPTGASNDHAGQPPHSFMNMQRIYRPHAIYLYEWRQRDRSLDSQGSLECRKKILDWQINSPFYSLVEKSANFWPNLSHPMAPHCFHFCQGFDQTGFTIFFD